MMNNSVRPLYHQSTVSKQTKILMQVRRVLTFSLTIKQNSHLLPPVQKFYQTKFRFFFIFFPVRKWLKFCQERKKKIVRKLFFFQKKNSRIALFGFLWTCFGGHLTTPPTEPTNKKTNKKEFVDVSLLCLLQLVNRDWTTIFIIFK